MEHILQTEILCTEKQLPALEGIAPPNEQWMKITIDLRHVISVRENLDEDGGPQVTLYTGVDCFTVRGQYEDIVPRWLKARGN
jgi:hypothetical protein